LARGCLLTVNRYYALSIETATPASQRHFLKYFFSYLDSVVDQAEERETHKKHTIDSYMTLRRENSGIYSSWYPAEATLDIPDEVYFHPAILYLADQSADLITLDNVCYLFIALYKP
jgi:Delta6-protoilludene synthase